MEGWCTASLKPLLLSCDGVLMVRQKKHFKASLWTDQHVSFGFLWTKEEGCEPWSLLWNSDTLNVQPSAQTSFQRGLLWETLFAWPHEVILSVWTKDRRFHCCHPQRDQSVGVSTDVVIFHPVDLTPCLFKEVLPCSHSLVCTGGGLRAPRWCSRHFTFHHPDSFCPEIIRPVPPQIKVQYKLNYWWIYPQSNCPTVVAYLNFFCVSYGCWLTYIKWCFTTPMCVAIYWHNLQKHNISWCRCTFIGTNSFSLIDRSCFEGVF